MTAYPLSLPAGGPLITLTHPTKSLWVIELHNGEESRLTLDLVNGGLMPALNAVEKHWRESWRVHQSDKKASKNEGRGALIIVGNRNQDKFFCNGLDLASAIKDPGYLPLTVDPMLHRLLTFPIPTIAAINGHAFAGGFMLTMACDYRVMTDGQAWLNMNEIHFGPPSFPALFGGILAVKYSDAVRRKIALEGHRFTPQEALEAGIIDATAHGNTDAVLARAAELAEKWEAYAQGGVWGLIRSEIYRGILEPLQKGEMRSLVGDVAAKTRL